MSWVNLNDLYATKTELATKVPTSRTINGKALSSNVTLGASDIKLSDNTTLQSAWDSISRATGADGTIGGGATYTMRNGVVVIVIRNCTLTSNVWRTLGQMPSDMCPPSVIYSAVNYSQYAAFACVDMNGVVKAYAPYGGDYTGQIVYCV